MIQDHHDNFEINWTILTCLNYGWELSVTEDNYLHQINSKFCYVTINLSLFTHCFDYKPYPPVKHVESVGTFSGQSHLSVKKKFDI